MFSTLNLLLSTTPLEGPDQMAFDEVLLGLVARPLLRIYRWKAPCVTFGYFQKYEMVKKLYPHQQLVRRWSGGGCVEHGEDFTFSLMIPDSEPIAEAPPSHFYRQLHEAIVVALQKHGIPARLADQEDQVAGESCFVAPCPCDVMLDRRKIVGGAQRRSKRCLLYQGSLHYRNTGYRLQVAGDDRSFAPLEEGDCEREFFLALAKQLSSEVTVIEEQQSWLEETHRLSCQRYQLASWTEKR